ncbi:hypothetical protein MASR1M97_23740 [Candidatus Desulfobacillus denitrificans]
MDSSAVEKPAYWRMVHGRTAYMVACGPRRKGSSPGRVSACGQILGVALRIQRLDGDAFRRDPVQGGDVAVRRRLGGGLFPGGEVGRIGQLGVAHGVTFLI